LSAADSLSLAPSLTSALPAKPSFENPVPQSMTTAGLLKLHMGCMAAAPGVRSGEQLVTEYGEVWE
jgi:hypothetical protein